MSKGKGNAFVYISSRLDEAGLSMAEFRVLCHIARRGASCTSSVATMAQICRANQKTVREVLKRLVNKGLITRLDRTGKSTVYRIGNTAPLPKETSGHTGHPSQKRPVVSKGSGDYPHLVGHPSQMRPAEGTPCEGDPKKERERRPRDQKPKTREGSELVNAALPPPTEREVKAEFAHRGMPEWLAEDFFERWSSRLWMDGYTPLGNWKRKVTTEFNYWVERGRPKSRLQHSRRHSAPTHAEVDQTKF